MNNYVGRFHQALSNHAVFSDALSNDVLISCGADGQKILMGFSSNVPSTMSIAKDAITLGNSSNEVNASIVGGLYVERDCYLKQSTHTSNLFVHNQLAVGTTDPNSNYKLHVNGSARIEGNLTINGTFNNINTNVNITDQFYIENAGTGPALIAKQTGTEPIVHFYDDDNLVFQVTDMGNVSIGTEDPVAKLDVQGNVVVRGDMSVSNLSCSNILASNLQLYSNLTVEHRATANSVFAESLYMGNQLVMNNTGVIVNSNFVPDLNTTKIVSGTFSSNFIRDRHIISDKITCNVRLDGTTFVNGFMGVGDTNQSSIEQYTRLKVFDGDITVAGRNNFATSGDQARINLGDSRYFIAGTSNVGIVMQVPGTTYPFLLENTTGFVGLGTMDPEERLHVKGHIKVDSNISANSISIGHSNPSETCSILGTLSLSNISGKVVMYTSSGNLGVNIAAPTAKVHIQQQNTGDAFRIDDASNDTTPFIVKDTGRVGIGLTAPVSELDVQGTIRSTSGMSVDGNATLAFRDTGVQAFQNGHWIFKNSNISSSNCMSIYKIDSTGTTNSSNHILFSDQGLIRVGGIALPTERLHVSNGNAKIDSNLYVMKSVGIGLSNPSEALHVNQNVKASNVYVDYRLGVANSNPQYTMDVDGDINITGKIFSNGGAIAGWVTSSNEDIYYLNDVSIGENVFDEKLHVGNGNAKFTSNIYVLGNIAIGHSNATEDVDAVGNIKSSSSIIGNNGVIKAWVTDNSHTVFCHSNFATMGTSFALKQDSFGGTVVNAQLGEYLLLSIDDIDRMRISDQGVNIQDVCTLTSNMYALQRVGIGNIGPSESLHVTGNVKVSNNIYAVNRISVAHSNPSEALDVVGNMKASSNMYVMQSLGVRNTVPKEAVDVTGNIKSSSNIYALYRVAVGASNPVESVDVTGNAKISSNLYTLNRIAVAHSNPTEALDIIGNAKMRSNAYVTTRFAVAHSNPTEAVDILGNSKITGKMYVLSNIAVGQSNPTEAVDIIGNAKVGSNVYVMNRLGLRTSNPSEVVDVQGNFKVSQYGYVMSGLCVGTSNVISELTVNGSAYFTDGMELASNMTIQQDAYIYNMTSMGHTSDPLEVLDVHGNIKCDSNIYSMNSLSVGTSNPTEAVHIVGNTKVTQSIYAMQSMGVGSSNPSEVLTVQGNTKVSSNVYVLHRCAIGHSNPSESMDIVGNFKVGTNAYVMQNLGIATSNVAEKVDVRGNIKTNSNVYVQNAIAVAHSNPKEAIDVIGNIRVSSNIYAINRLGVGTSNPSEGIDIIGNAKVSTNLYSMQKLAVGTSNPLEALHVVGNARVNGGIFVMTNFGIGTSNPSEIADITGNCKIQNKLFVSSNIGIGSSNPFEALDVYGNMRSRSNIYSANAIGVNTLVPSERVHAEGNIKATSNIYAMNRLGVGTSNPTHTLHVIGDMNYSGKIYNSGAEVLPWKTSSSNLFYDQRVSVGTNVFDEQFNVNVGNAKFNNNVYVMGNVGIGTNVPEHALDVVGNVKASNGTLGPMIMLIPPIAYADISVNSRLVLDNTIEAGNDIADSTWKPLFYGSGFLYQDLSGESMAWNEARLIFRGMALTTVTETTTMTVQDFVYNRTPTYSNVTDPFAIETLGQSRGYITSATPWFSMSSTGVRHLAIFVSSSTTVNAVYRFGSVYLQFR